MSSIAFVTLVNDRAQLAACQESLRAQADPFPDWLEVEPNAEGWNAARGLNHGIDSLTADWIVSVHQDVLFPAGFWSRFKAAIAGLPPDVALAGVAGCECDGRFRGHIVDPNGHCFWGPLPGDVLTLDEVLIAVRRSSGLRFDPKVPGFHCYGADICFRAEELGLRTVVLDASLVHLSTGRIDASYHEAAQWLLRRWGARHAHVLPTPTIVVQDRVKAPWLHRTKLRLRRRADRLARNQNPCGHEPCDAARLAAAIRSESQT